MKTCSKCNIDKRECKFYRNKSRKDGLSVHCKDCMKRYRKSEDGQAVQSRYAKSEKRKAVLKQYHASEKGQSCKRRYYTSDKGKQTLEKYVATERGRQVRRAAQQKYRHTRRRIESGRIHSYVWKFMESIRPDGFHIDHITPISRGGTADLANLCLLPASVNCSKQDKTVDEFGRDVFEKHAIFPNCSTFVKWLISYTEEEI